MHADEVDIDLELVSELLIDQFPDLAGLDITAVRSTGTVNAIYRIGDGFSARLPRSARWVPDLDKELRWLPMLARHLSLAIPEPVGRGRPSGRYPFPWAVYRWIEGQPYADALVTDERHAAADLARFVLELRGVDPDQAPTGGRKPLLELDAVTRWAIDAAGDAIDGHAATTAWEAALRAPEWDGSSAWIHADLLRPNLLVEHGRLCAVIDFGAAGIGDPATDVIAAWSTLGQAGREVFRSALAVDDATWSRARGIALHQAAAIIPYYRTTNPAFVALAVRTVEEVVADSAG
jgi:aminoglycoside phosphotransferase (APT) family kinase protein